MTQSVLDVLQDEVYNVVRRATYVALDYPTWEQAKQTVDLFGEAVDGYKVGLELFHQGGSQVVEELVRRGKRVFFDMKLHDIPNTVAGALHAISELGVEMVNVHAAGGRKMLEAAREAVHRHEKRPLLIAVTILTSLSDADLSEVGFRSPTLQSVLGLVDLTAQAGLDGVVASAQEIEAIRARVGEDFEIVVPGTRPLWAEKNDQTRFTTPEVALASGATRLVLGRPVTKSPDPLVALKRTWDDMVQYKARM